MAVMEDRREEEEEVQQEPQAQEVRKEPQAQAMVDLRETDLWRGALCS